MKSYKFRLYPNKIQRQELQLHLFYAKNLWNSMLQITMESYKNYGYFTTTKTLQEISKNSGLYAQTAQDIDVKIQNAIKRFLKLKKQEAHTSKYEHITKKIY